MSKEDKMIARDLALSFGDRASKTCLGRKAARNALRHARMEPLESRTMLTVVFDPVFGVETQKHDGSDGKMHRPPINVVFWGPFWQGNNANDPNHWDSASSPDAVTVLTAIDN